ncbi:hypothetical protein WOC76_21310 [Methylocystis sp. IM3]|uniref:hypothetical protein n=1 Tax=unclassified Methylocystis TaxID=2625913 RepID=UPI0030F5A2D2
MVRKTTASASEDRRKRRLPARQMDLFPRGVAAGAPNWPDLPKDAQQALVVLMTRLILEYARTTTMGAGHER